MEFEQIALVAGFVLAYSLVSRRLETTLVTGPMVFVGFGLLIGSAGFNIVDIGMQEGAVRVLAEATLVLLLFTDAIRIDLRLLRRQLQLPARLLGLGLPLTLIAGTILAALLFSDLSFWEAALLAAILSPTDAALGQAVVANPRVPARIRQALNVESGLNDGIMLPVITLVLALAAADGNLETPGHWVAFATKQIGFGVLAGAGAGYLGGRLVREFAGRDWMQGAFRQLATLATGVGTFALAEAIGGNGFVAAFVAGLAFGAAARDYCEGIYDFVEDEGQLLALLTFLFFGVSLAGPALDDLTWQIAIYALLSLTAIRMIPVAISLIGADLKAPTIGFIGWFGPRGLASIVFGLSILEEAELPVGNDLFLTVTWTVLLSVALHGASSVWLSQRYGSWFAAHGRQRMREAEPVEEMPTR
ncbi:MAG: cation:proton antiporter [Acidimicrobiia bacterium]